MYGAKDLQPDKVDGKESTRQGPNRDVPVHGRHLRGLPEKRLSHRQSPGGFRVRPSEPGSDNRQFSVQNAPLQGSVGLCDARLLRLFRFRPVQTHHHQYSSVHAYQGPRFVVLDVLPADGTGAGPGRRGDRGQLLAMRCFPQGLVRVEHYSTPAESHPQRPGTGATDLEIDRVVI